MSDCRTALSKIGPAALPELINLLADQDRFVRMTAAKALGDMGPPAKEAVPALNDALNDDDKIVRRYASVALDRIEGPKAPMQRIAALPKVAPTKAKAEQEATLRALLSEGWSEQASYTGDPRARPPGTVCLSFEDGYMWLIAESVVGREQRVEGGRTIEIVLGSSQRYEHVLGTYAVRTVGLAPTPAEEENSGAP